MQVGKHSVAKTVVDLVLSLDEAAILYRILCEATDVDYKGKEYSKFRVELAKNLRELKLYESAQGV